MHRQQPIKSSRPEDGVPESSNERMRRAFPNNSLGYTHNGAEQPWQPYQAPQRSLEHAQQTGTPMYSDLRTQADEAFFQQCATGPRWNYLRTRRLPEAPPRRQAVPLTELAYHPPPWNTLENGSNQRVAQNPQPPTHHVFTETAPGGITLAPLDPEEQRYWREEKGRPYREILEPNKLVAENLRRSSDSYILEQFNGASDIGELWGEKH